MTIHEKCLQLHRLHESSCFVIPNPWDAGSAVVLEQLGFPALATTSSGFAWTQARADNHVTLDQALGYFRQVSAAVSVPVSADFEGGFAVDPADVAANVAAAAETGIAGLSIEDSTGVAERPLFDFDLAVSRVRAARQAIDSGAHPLLLTARSEGYIVGRPDLEETIRRLKAFAAAGAHCVYAPGLSAMGDVRALVAAVAPTPVNVLATSEFTVAELASAGVRRISVGGALARTAWSGFVAAASEIASQGTFTSFGKAMTGAELNERFA